MDINDNILKDLLKETNTYFDRVEAEEEKKHKNNELGNVVRKSLDNIENITKKELLDVICSNVKSNKTYSKRATLDHEIHDFIQKVKEITGKAYNKIINELLRLIVDHEYELEKIKYFNLEEEQKCQVEKLFEKVESVHEQKVPFGKRRETVSKTLVLDEDTHTFVTIVEQILKMKTTDSVNELLKALILNKKED